MQDLPTLFKEYQFLLKHFADLEPKLAQFEKEVEKSCNGKVH
jgi:hypothetical protein